MVDIKNQILNFRMWGFFGDLGISSLIFSQTGHLLASFLMKVTFQKIHSVLWRMWLSHSTLFTVMIVIKCHNDIKLFHGIGHFLLRQWLLTEKIPWARQTQTESERKSKASAQERAQGWHCFVPFSPSWLSLLSCLCFVCTETSRLELSPRQKRASVKTP